MTANTPADWSAKLKALNVTAVRTWGPSIDPKTNVSGWFTKYVKPWTDAGFTVVVCLTPREEQKNPSLADATTFFQNVKKAIAGVPVIIEVWNEPNLTIYNSNAKAKGWAAEVVSFLKSAREVFGPDQKIVGPSTTYGASAKIVIDTFADLVNAGMLDHIDYVNCHPYAPDAAGVIERVKGIVALSKGKPLFLTEWNVKADQKKWSAEIGKAFAGIAPLTNTSFFYRLHPNAAGEAGQDMNTTYPYTAAGKPSAPFDTVKAAMALSTTPSTPEEQPRQPQGTLKHKVSGVVYKDLNNDGKRQNTEAVAGVVVRVFDARHNVVSQKVTDQYGYYLTDLLTPGDYSVQIGDTSTKVSVVDQPVKLDLKVAA